MSTEQDVRDDFIDQIETLLAGVPVSRWAGEEAAFNDALAWPAIYVSAMALDVDPAEEVGPNPLTYVVRPVVYVFVAGKDTASTNGDDTCMTMLETIRRGLIGQTIASLGTAEMTPGFEGGRAQALIGVRQGQYLYGQAWSVTVFEETSS